MTRQLITCLSAAPIHNLDFDELRLYTVHAQKIAEELGHVRYMGIASLGALTAVDARFSMQELERTIKTDVKLRRFEKANLQALQLGANATKTLTPKT